MSLSDRISDHKDMFFIYEALFIIEKYVIG